MLAPTLPSIMRAEHKRAVMRRVITSAWPSPARSPAGSRRPTLVPPAASTHVGRRLDAGQGRQEHDDAVQGVVRRSRHGVRCRASASTRTARTPGSRRAPTPGRAPARPARPLQGGFAPRSGGYHRLELWSYYAVVGQVATVNAYVHHVARRHVRDRHRRLRRRCVAPEVR